ncbi:MAG TPA: hypothetical protein VFK74_10015, partial [Azospira sp.]|nr:hypothetical protein [Azospira sp.]
MGLSFDDYDPVAGEPIPGYCGDLPAVAGQLLQEAAACGDEGRSEFLILKAHHSSPCHFAVYLALYKCYVHRRRFEAAEQWMR